MSWRGGTGAVLVFSLFTTFSWGADSSDPEMQRLRQQVAKLAEEKIKLTKEIQKRDAEIKRLKALVGEDATPTAEKIDAPAEKADVIANENPARTSTKGPWAVKIVANKDPDMGPVREQLDGAKSQLVQARTDIGPLKARYDRVSTERRWNRDLWYNGRRGNWELVHTNQQIKVARADWNRAEGKVKDLTSKIARLEKRLAEGGEGSREVIAQSVKGESVTLVADNAAMAVLAKSLREGEWYKVDGAGAMSNYVLTVKLRSAVETTAP